MHDLGIKNPPKTLDIFNQMRYNNSPEYQIMQKYITSVESGMLSPLTTYELYEKYYIRVENELVGKTTSNGINISGQSQHFLERVFGTMSDPTHEEKKRNGVNLDDAIDAVLNGTVRPVKISITDNGEKRPSQLFYNGKCSVSINPDTGVLIQCQPIK